MKTKSKFSLKKYIVISFVIYTLIIFIFVILISFYNNWKLNNSFLVIDDFLEYESMLKYENYGSIPMSKFPGCDFLIYDGNNELIYATNRDIASNIDGDDIEYINNYTSNYYYDIFNLRNKNGEKITKIYKTVYDDDLEEDVVVGTSVLNSDLVVESGSLFNKDNKLTNRELNLLKGYYNDDKMIEKYEYNTVYDIDAENQSKRTLVFLSPSFNSDTYDDLVSSSEKIWFIAIPFLILLISFETYLFSKRINKYLKKLDNVINNYENNNIVNEELPKEFEGVINSFVSLMNKLKKSESEKINIYKDKQRVIANLSHDLKTPLTVIQGYSKAFLDNLVPDDKKYKYMETIYNKSIITTSTIDSLSLYANMSHPEYKLNKEYMDIVKYTKDYLAYKYSDIELNGMSLDINIKINKCMINMDPKEFRRIYENIINNSIKYNKNGTKIYFEMGISDSLYIIIGDNGIGIDEKIRNKIFDAFVTSNDARTNGDATGLGLSIVKSLVLLHDGNISLESKCKKELKTQFLIKIKI